jgi:Holliday junction resolvase RusA-like endonuclease|tara:strand:+ start:190 stop:591 length:402 start_codon:yes stop_codon:yes gene_type:complete
MVTMILPLEVYYSKNKKFILNLNNYRNAHYRILSSAKRIYSENLVAELNEWSLKPKFKNPVTLEYVYYAKSNRRVDVSNPCSIIDKFTCDALVKAEILEDDSSKQIKEIYYVYGGVDKEFPRCRLTIKEVWDD